MKIKRYKLILIFVFLGSVLIDVLTGLYRTNVGMDSILSPGVFYRGFILTPVFLIVLFRKKNLKLQLFVLYLVTVFLCASVYHLIHYHYLVSFLDNVNRFLKLLFLFLGFGAMIYWGRKYPAMIQDRQYLWRIGVIYGVIVALSIIVTFIVGAGFATYQYQAFSSRGMFQAQNEFSIVLVITLTFVLYYIYEYKGLNLAWLLLADAVYVFAAFLIGTRAAIVGVGIILFFFHLLFVLKGNHSIWKLTYKLTAVIIGFIVIGLFSYWIWNTQDMGWTMQKFEVLLSEDSGINYGTLHARAKVPEGVGIISNFDLFDHMFGIGDTQFLLTENDLIDVYGKFGLAVLVPLLLFFSRYLIKLLITFLMIRANLAAFALLTSLAFYILHASIAGHAFMSAPVNNLLILVLYLAYLELTTKRYSAIRVTRTGSDNFVSAVPAKPVVFE